MIDQPGIYEIKAAEYHADPVGPAPSLSSSIMKELISSSAWHAWYAHPRLNPAFQRKDEDKFDLGTAAHAFALEGETGFAVVPSTDWRTAAAKAMKAEARLNGKTPLLAEQWQRVQEMIQALHPQLDQFEDPPRPLSAGQPERTIVWKEGATWFRIRIDWLHDDQTVIDDFKTSGASANPATWDRQMINMGYDIQAALYLRGLQAVTKKAATFRFVVQENWPPYAAAVMGVPPAFLELGTRKVEYAIRLWRECMASKKWPGYPHVTCYPDVPAWGQACWLAQEMNQPMPPARGDDFGDLPSGRDLEEELFGDKA